MFGLNFGRFFRSKKKQPIRKANKPQKKVYLHAEQLEDRLVPATISQWNFGVTPAPVLLNGIRTDDSGGPSDVWATNNGPGFLTTLGMTNDYDGNNSVVGDDILLTTGGPGDTTLRVRAPGSAMGAPGNGWANGAPDDSQGIQIDSSTVGYTSLQLSFDWYCTTHGVANMQVQYTGDYTQANPTWTTITGQTGEDSTYNYFTAVPNAYYGTTSPNLTITIPSDANNDPTFAIRLVSTYYQNTTNYADAANNSATYADGSGNWRFGNVAVSGTLTAGEVTTTTTLATSPSGSPQPQGVPITLTATVAPASGTVRPAGTVEFFDGNVLINSTSTFSNGSSSSSVYNITTSSLPTGNHYFWAEYVPSGAFTSSIGTDTSSTNPYIISNTVATTSVLSANPSPPVQAGTTVTFTDTITPGYGTNFPTGSVNFYNGSTSGTPLNASPIAVTEIGNTTQGMAQFSDSGLPAGTYNIVAVYTATGNFVSSTSAALGYSIYSGSSGAFTPGNLVLLQSGDESGSNYNAQAPLYLDEETTAGVGVQQVAIPDVGAATITTAMESGGTVTITTGNAPGLTGNGFTNGEYLAITGLSQYNGTYQVATTGANTFTYSVTDNGDVTVNTGATATPGQVGNQPITMDLSASAGIGQLNRSYDGSALTFDGVDSTINSGGLSGGATPTGSDNRDIAVVTGNANVTSNINTTTYGPFYVGDDNRGSVAESPTGPIYTAGHPNQAGGAVSQGVHEFDSTDGASTGAQIGDQVSASTNIRAVTIGFDNRMYFSTAGGLGGAPAVNGGGIFTEVQPLPTSATPTPANDIMVVPSIFSASKLGGVFLADMNGDGIVDNGDRLYFLDDGTVGGAGTGGLYVSTWNDSNTQYAWNTPNNAAAVAAGFVDHWGLPVRLGDAPVQAGSSGVGELRGLTGTVISSGIANASVSGSTVTITLAGSNSFQNGQNVQISGVGSGYDGSWTISNVSGNTFEYTDANTTSNSVTPPDTALASQAVLYTTAFDNKGNDASVVQQWVDTNTGVSIANAQVISGSGSSSVVQITTATPNTIQTGQVVEVDGVGATNGTGAITSGYNGAWTVTVIDSTHFTYTDTQGATITGAVNNQGSADVAIQTDASQESNPAYSNLNIGNGPGFTLGGTIIQDLDGNVNTIGGSSYAAIGLRGVSFAPVAATVVSLAQSPINPLQPGSSVTLTATLTNTEVTPTGRVAFIDENTNTILGFGTISTVAGVSSASLTLPTGLVGNHYVRAYFAGGGTLALASALSNTIKVIESGSQDALTVLSSSLSAVAVGQQVTLTATVTTSALGATNATGTVSFFNGAVSLANLLGTSTLNASGQATLSVAFPSTGANTITAIYNGDANYESGEQSNIPITITVANNATATISTSANNVALNAIPTYTATITGNAALGAPGGTVTFNIVAATTHASGSGDGVPDLNITSSAMTLTPGPNNTATAVWTGPALAYPGSYLVTITYTATAGGPYTGFTVSSESATGGNALIETVQQAFTPGDFVVVQRGDGTVNLGSNSYLVFVDEYAPPAVGAGANTPATPIQSIAMANVDSGSQHALFLSGQNGSEGLINLSANGYDLTLGGYDIPAGHTFITSTFAYQYPRTIAEINGAGSINTSTAIGTLNGTGTPVTISGATATSTSAGATVTLTIPASTPSSFFVVGQQISVSGITTSGYNGTWTITAVTGTTVKYVDSNPLGATTAVLGSTPQVSSPASVPYNPDDVVSNDGNEFWITSSLPVGDTTDSGIGYVSSVGATTETEIGPIGTGAAAVSIAGGQLYVTNGSGNVQAVGTGLPSSAGQALAGLPNLAAAYQAYFPNAANPEQVLLLNTNDGTSNNPNVAYIADQANGLLKFYLDGSGNWQYGSSGTDGNQQGFFGQKLPGAGGVTGVTGYVVNPGSTNQATNPTEIQLYVTGSNVTQANPNQIDSLLDTHAAPIGSGSLAVDNGFASGQFSVMGLVGGASYGGSPNGNENFAGIAFVPGYVTGTAVTKSTDGTNYTFTATVTSPSAPSNIPGGAVYFYLNGSTTSLGTGMLVNGVATLTVPNSMIPAGSNTVTAAYQGDVKDGTSTGAITWSGTAFTAGNLIATVVGTGSTLTANGTATFINEYAPTGGAAVQTVALPTSGTNPFTEKGTTATQGYLIDSADGHSVSIAGYEAAAGNSTTGANGEIGLIGPNGTIDTSTQISASDTSNGVTAAVSADGLGFWISTSNYVRYVPFDNSALTPSTQVSNFYKTPNVVEIQTGNNQTGTLGVPGQLYVTGGAGAQSNGIGALDGPAQILGGLADVAGQAGKILGNDGTAGTDFNVGKDAAGNFPATDQIAISPDGLNIFVADSRTDGSGGILWYYNTSGNNWTLLGHAQVSGATADSGLYALVADWSGVTTVGGVSTGPVTLYGTTTAANANRIVQIAGFVLSGSPSYVTPTFTTVETAAANTAFRGVAFAPTAAGTQAPVSTVLNVTGASYPGTTLSATVTGNGVFTPTGYVSFQTSAGIEIGSAPLINGVATLTPTSDMQVLESGNLVAVYTGDSFYSAQTSTAVSATVTQGTPTVTLTPQFTSVATGVADSLSAQVTYAGSNAAPTGTVTFWQDAVGAGGVNLGTFPLVQTIVNVGGTPTVEFLATGAADTFTASGAHSMVAVYNGDSNFLSQSSSAATVNVTLPSTTTVTTNMVDPTASPSQMVTLTATVTGSGATPTGTVAFYDNSLLIAANVGLDSSGKATVTLSTSLLQQFGVTLLPGLQSITAIYSGDGNYFQSSGVYEQAVQAQTFGAGDQFVYRVGDGITSLLAPPGNPNANTASIGSTIYVDEINSAGSVVQSIILPSADGAGSQSTIHAVVGNGQQSDTEQISVSGNGQYLFLVGYDNNPLSGATAAGTGIGTTAAAIPTVAGSIPTAVARIDQGGNVTDIAYLNSVQGGGNFNGVYSEDGNEVWTSGFNGVTYSAFVPSASLQSATTITGFASSHSLGQTLEPDGSNLAAINGSPSATSTESIVTAYSGYPSAAATPTNLPGVTAAAEEAANGESQTSVFPVDVYFTHLDYANGTAGPAGINTMYISDDGPSFAGGAITKWALVSGTWQAVGSVRAGTGNSAVSFYYISGSTASEPYTLPSGTVTPDSWGDVTLDITYGNGGNADTGPGYLYQITDDNGYDASIGSSGAASTAVSTVASVPSGSNETYRGVASFGIIDLTGSGTPVAAVAGTPFTGQVATFTDPDSNANVPGNYSATITWGDGSASTGTVTFLNNNGGESTYSITGTHTYGIATAPGANFPTRVSIGASGWSGHLIVTSTATVATAGAGYTDLTGTGIPVTSTPANPILESSAFTAEVATFSAPVPFGGSPLAASTFTAMINWGDGSPTSAGTITLANPGATYPGLATYTVTGTHTYPQYTVTPYNVSITISSNVNADDQNFGINTTATVLDAFGSYITGSAVNITATQGTPFTTTVATFNHPVPNGGTTSDPAADYTATINWGDGSPLDTGTVTLVNTATGDYSVSGTHTYTSAGPFSLTVTIAGDDLLAPLVLSPTATTGVTTTTSLSSNPVGPITQGTAVDFTATIANSNPGDVGTVSFYYDYGQPDQILISSNVPVSGGSATSATTTALPAGSDLITAIYSGGTGFQGSTGTLTIQVTSSSAPPSITSVIINQDISALYNAAGQPAPGTQRSMVNDVVYTFSEAVNIDPTDPNVFSMTVAAGWTGTVPTLSWAPVAGSGNTQWAVSFSGSSVTGGSIANGAYDITVQDPASITAVSDSQALTLAGSGIGGPTQSFYRLYGDINGDEVVNAADNLKFKQALSTYNAAFDFNDDGFVNASDNLKFKGDLTVNFSGFTPTI